MLGSPALRRRSCLCKVFDLFLPELCPVLTFKMRPLENI
jgi:hypothetical protein